MKQKQIGKKTLLIGVIGAGIFTALFIAGTVFTSIQLKADTEKSVKEVSLLYLDELAGRREQVVSNNITSRTNDITTALNLMSDDDLSSEEKLRSYQTRMKEIYGLEKFAFVDTEGTIYTSIPTTNTIDEYSFDYQTLSEPDVSIFNLKSHDKKVVIAVPTNKNYFSGKTFKVCFIEIDMVQMLSGVSMESREDDATFCNIYTKDGVALSNTVLGGLAAEDNLLDALAVAKYDSGYSYNQVENDFNNGKKGTISFTYQNVSETLSYVPIKGTDWFLTYLIRESVIASRISSVTNNLMIRTFLISGIIIVVLISLFAFLILQLRKNSKIQLESEKQSLQNKIEHEELEHRLMLQDQLIEQNKLITALSSNYWSVYYLELDNDTGVCYQAHSDLEHGFKAGETFKYLESFIAYANEYVGEAYREEFIKFIQPENIKKSLKEQRVISYRYIVKRHNVESYEMVMFAGVRHPEDREGDDVHSVGACFNNVDEETRLSIAQNLALSDALKAAEEASKAKTIFLSNMSHEIRTPLNAIIGLDNIALNDTSISKSTRGYLEKIDFSAEHLLSLINDILDMSRIESGKMTLRNEEFSFSKLLEYINTMFSSQCQEKNLEYHCKINGDIEKNYIGDNMKIRQVLINLLGNAVKFTNPGGEVTLTIEKVASFNNKTTLRFIVKDTGIGISEEFLPHIFDSFAQEDSRSTNKYGSSGLGLAITKNMIDMMNGIINVESIKGKGSTFTITITLEDAKKEEKEFNVNVKLDEMNVLVIDDDEIALEHARLVLEKAGAHVEIANSGNKAIEMVKINHARKLAYNLILVDWKMPDIDGVETTREIRKIVGNESAIIILTAYKWDDILDEALNAGVDSFISKPVFADDVIEEFAEALRRKEIVNGQNKVNKTSLAGKRILLAEDVEINSEIMKAVLEMREMEVEIAENGLIALNMFSSHPENYYSAILMDMRMPEMDGLEATRRIRSLDRKDAKEIPIIALTANAFDEDVQRSLQAGLNAHLSKPVKAEVVYETLEEYIKK